MEKKKKNNQKRQTMDYYLFCNSGNKAGEDEITWSLTDQFTVAAQRWEPVSAILAACVSLPALIFCTNSRKSTTRETSVQTLQAHQDLLHSQAASMSQPVTTKLTKLQISFLSCCSSSSN